MNKRFCPSCGQQIIENGPFCVSCGYQLNQQTQNTVSQNTAMPNQQVMAGVENLNLDGNNNAVAPSHPVSNKGKIGLIFGIVAFFIFGFLAYAGLPLSIGALKEAKANGGAGKGVAIAGIVICSIDCVLVTLNIILAVVTAVSTFN